MSTDTRYNSQEAFLEGRTGTTPPSTSRRTSSGASAPGGLSASEIVELRQRLMAMRIQAPGRSLAATPPSPTPTRRPARRGRPPIRPALRPPDPATALRTGSPSATQDHRVSRPSHRSQAPIKYREPLPAIQTVRTALEQLRIEHASSGRRVSVLSLARRPGIPNTTLRRTYPEICAEIAAATRTAATEPAADDSAYARHQRDNAALRRANRGTRRAPGDRHREHPAPQHRQPPAPARRSSHQRDAATSTTSSIPPRACGRTSRAKSLPTTLLKALRSLPTRPTPASGGSAAGHGCCSPSLTVPGFRYDQPSPYSANVIKKRLARSGDKHGRCPQLLWAVWPRRCHRTARSVGDQSHNVAVMDDISSTTSCMVPSTWRSWEPGESAVTPRKESLEFALTDA